MIRYAMCLVEIVDCQLPWTGVAAGGEVTRKVTSAARPNRQLQDCDSSLAALIRDCWHHTPHRRPDFTSIVGRLEEMAAGLAQDSAGGQAARGNSRPASPSHMGAE